MIALFSDINPMMLWLIAGALLILFEIILPGVYLFWIGIAALMVGGVLTVIDLSIILQILLFAILHFLQSLSVLKPIKEKRLRVVPSIRLGVLNLLEEISRCKKPLSINKGVLHLEIVLGQLREKISLPAARLELQQLKVIPFSMK